MIDLAICVLIATTTPHTARITVSPTLKLQTKKAPVIVYRCPIKPDNTALTKNKK